MKQMQSYKDDKNNIIYYALYKNLDEILINSKFEFSGSGNIVFLDENAKLENCTICLKQNNIFFMGNSFLKKNVIVMWQDSLCYIGHHNYFNPHGQGRIFIISAKTNVIIGNFNLFSINIWFRTSDPHLIYDKKTNKRINHTKSIFIGDNVWVGQDCAFLKGVFVATGAVIGACSVLSNKTYYSNTINAGVPCKELKQNIFWKNFCDQDWDDETSKKYEFSVDNNFDFNENEFLDPKELDNKLLNLKDIREKFDFVYEKLYLNMDKNRFSLTSPLKNEYRGAVFRVKNMLSYKLGACLISNSKSFSGVIALPFKLLKIAIKNKRQSTFYNNLINIHPKFILPGIESYSDYKEALHYKNHLSYKLGFGLITSSKRYWGGD
ncbi:hypothetical protein FMM58_00925 [Campylobacter sp. LR291e]|uniref:hypothetical protein n=1 Tax=Campylobacter sp. LR291e TaxID=2593546 RepID=UPI0012386183|nr:hypothetical protein [Campylobacter sp. LR291e]KAA6234084.1 hypothetical protein FMM58_00925 [Campylobacter sp. LR291e]